MAQSYTRQSSFADGDTITAALFNDEYNQLINTFAYSSSDASNTGHRHDGTSGQGGNIFKIGDIDFLNKIEVDGTNNRIGFYVQVSTSTVEQIRVQDGAVVPVTDNDIDLGTSSLEFKDAFFDGTVTADALVADTADINGGTVDGAIIGGSSAAAITGTTITGTTITGTSFVIGSADINEAELETIDGVTAGTVAASKAVVVDSNKDIGSFRNITLTGELDAGSLDVSGDVDIDGTLEADAITVNGATLNEVITDAVGSMVSSNTETGIAVSFDDSDNTLDFVIGTLNQDTTGNAATATALETARTIHGVSFDGTANIDLSEVIQDTVGAMVSSNTESGITVAYQDADGTLDFTIGTLNQDTTGTAALATAVTISANNSTDETIFPVFVDGATGTQGLETDTGFTYNPSTGLLTATGFSGNLTGTLQTAAQTNITSVGTLSSLTVSGDATFDTSTLKVDSSNNRVGIGTTSPSDALHVVGDITINSNTPHLKFTSADNSSNSYYIGANISDSVDGGLQIGEGTALGSNVRLAISGAGNLGIGTTSPDTKLHIVDALGGGQLLVATSEADDAEKYGTFGTQHYDVDQEPVLAIAAQSSSSENNILIGGALGEFNAATSIKFFTGANTTTTTGSERMRIDSSGNVGIGTTSPVTIGGHTGILTLFGSNATALVLKDSSGEKQLRLDDGNFSVRNSSGDTHLMVLNGGNVGLGTDSPDSLLHLETSSNPTLSFYRNDSGILLNNGLGMIQFGGSDSGDTNDSAIIRAQAEDGWGASSCPTRLSFWTTPTSSTSATERMRIDKDGRLSVGITSSAGGVATFFGTGTGAEAKVQIEGEGGADPFINFLVNNTTHWSVGARDSDSDKFMIANNSDLSSGVALTIDSSENVGIGTASPGTKLDVAGIIQTDDNIRISEDKFIYSYKGGTSGQVRSGFKLDGTNQSVDFYTAQNERMMIDSSGNVGIGITAPAVPLEVAGNIKVNASNGSGFVLNSSSTTGIFRQNSNDLGFTVGGSERVRIDSSGNFLINRTSQIGTNKVSINYDSGGKGIAVNQAFSGSGTFMNFLISATTVGSISTDGSSTGYNTSSDARLKDITGSARGLEVINELNPVAYDWKADGKSDEGLIAQEVMELVPNAVSGSEKDMYQMDYSKLVVHLVKGMQEQQEQIESLKSEIQLLKGGK